MPTHNRTMKVLRNTPDQLIVENNPILLAILLALFGLVFAAIGLAIVSDDVFIGVMFTGAGLLVAIGGNMAFTRRTQVILERSAGQVTLRRRAWNGYTVMTWELQYLERAVTQTMHSGDSDTYRAALVINGGMDEGIHPVTLVYSSGYGADIARDAINGWLDSRQTTL